MILALWCALAGTLLGSEGPAPKPKLVVMITVDLLRPDFFDRYHSQLRGGLDLLRREGAFFTHAYQDHAVTETAPGYATVLSGRWPAHTGIVRNAAGVQDPTAPLLEVGGPGASPARFRGTALLDWLEAVDSGARALSVSRKDRGAILPVGRSRQQVYWYQSGVFTTSRYYADSLQTWVRVFNAERVPFKAAGAAWTLLLPDTDYAEPDTQVWENGGSDVAFPHRLPLIGTRAAAAFAEVPAMDSLTLAFALAGVDALGLGRRGSTDLLAVGLSATDAVGHAFGPDSREIHDQFVRLDRYLGWFLGGLFRRYGRENLLIALTADHGVTPLPERSRAEGHHEATRVLPDSIVQSVNAELRARMGQGTGDWLEFDSGMFLVRDRDARAAAGVDVDSLVGALAAQVRALPGVARVDRPADLVGTDTAADPVARRWLHDLAPPSDAGVVLVVTLEPYSIWGYDNLPIAMHGQPSDFDAHVPLMLWGRGVRRGVYHARASTVDIAPTLARLLGVTPLERLDGRVLTEALSGGR